ncbi:hypothetical protein L596_013861 [Steinernema carpocapsae]|uniref:Mucolipin extracytosolic domain-containing protein n=1 Tax=Steinernema carpocapsae TaxID=34508 RepID=A0A4U5P1G7_STECR|nr:hypothetical protein L596_013861 [Steinernema carpocapsae]
MLPNGSQDVAPLLQDQVSGERLKRTLYFFFLNPVDKWSLRKTFPGKLIFKIVLAVLVASQLVLFSQERMPYFEYATRVDRVLHHKFLKNWDSDNDPYAFPPGEKVYLLYERTDVYKHLGHVVLSYYNLKNDTLGSFAYYNAAKQVHVPEMSFCQKPKRKASKICQYLKISEADVEELRTDLSYIEDVLSVNNVSLFNGLQAFRRVYLEFSLESIHESDHQTKCHQVQTFVYFDNSKRNDMVDVSLSIKLSPILCSLELISEMEAGLQPNDWLNIILDVILIACCLFSMALAIKSLMYGVKLMQITDKYIHSRNSCHLSFIDKLRFFHVWYVVVILNDILVIAGTCIKLNLANTDFNNALYTCTSMFLGCAVFVVAIDLLRYLTFLNVLISMTKFMTNVLQLILCAGILYSAFLLAGWTIIGPYSPKFHTVSRSSKTLFSLLNGDDMFATFVTVETSSQVLLVFSTIFVYSFVIIFIYVMLSLVIAIFENAWYRTVEDQSRYNTPQQKTDLDMLVEEMDVDTLNDAHAAHFFERDQLL